MRFFYAALLVALFNACSPTPVSDTDGTGGTTVTSKPIGLGGAHSSGGVTSASGGVTSLGGSTIESSGGIDGGVIVTSGGGSGGGGAGGSKGAGGAKGGAGGTATVRGNCHDSLKNQDETDVDCGGQICAPRCAAGKGCQADDDCTTATPAYVCEAATKLCTDPCADGKQDGDETGVDCGGTCPLKCLGDTCTSDSNCKSDTCDIATKTCKPTAHPLANINQTCWDGLAKDFNPTAVTTATSKLIPCMLANRCCKTVATTCTDPCFADRDKVCGVNNMGKDDAPYQLVRMYYQKCVVP